jgi:hypothetical protein
VAKAMAAAAADWAAQAGKSPAEVGKIAAQAAIDAGAHKMAAIQAASDAAGKAAAQAGYPPSEIGKVSAHAAILAANATRITIVDGKLPHNITQIVARSASVQIALWSPGADATSARASAEAAASAVLASGGSMAEVGVHAVAAVEALGRKQVNVQAEIVQGVQNAMIAAGLDPSEVAAAVAAAAAEEGQDTSAVAVAAGFAAGMAAKHRNMSTADVLAEATKAVYEAGGGLWDIGKVKEKLGQWTPPQPRCLAFCGSNSVAFTLASKPFVLIGVAFLAAGVAGVAFLGAYARRGGANVMEEVREIELA